MTEKSQAEIDWEEAREYTAVKRARARLKRSERVYALSKAVLALIIMYALYVLYQIAFA